MNNAQFRLKFPKEWSWLYRHNRELLNLCLPTYKKWTKQELMKCASKYSSIKQWREEDSKSYRAARKLGIVRQISSHMSCLRGKKLQKKVIALETRRIFSGISEAGRLMNATNIFRAIKNGTKCGGYHWAYCDEKGNIIK